jgi:3-oxoacyl-[acyl-carrier-protein] synthase III
MTVTEGSPRNIFELVRGNAHLTRERLSPESRSHIWQERYESPSGITGSVAHFGERFPRWLINKIITDRFNEKPVEDTGFSVLYRTPEGETDEQIDRDIIEAARKLAEETLKQKGWTIEEVQAIDFTSSMGRKGLAREVAKALGVTEEAIRSGKTEVTGKYMACDGSGRAIYDRLRNPKSDHKKVLVISVDPVTSLMPFDKEKVDTRTMQLFSNGAAALAYQSGVDMKLITGETEAIWDEKGIRAIPRYYDQIKGLEYENGPLYRFDNDGIIEEMIGYPYPPNGHGEMDGKATFRFFVVNAGNNILSVYKKYKELFPDRDPEYVVGHHPSKDVLDGLKHYFAKSLGDRNAVTVLDKFRWVVPDGNSSGSTSLIAFNRSMHEYKPGDHVFYLSYGAGGSFTSFMVEIGPGNKVISLEEPQTLAA